MRQPARREAGSCPVFILNSFYNLDTFKQEVAKTAKSIMAEGGRNFVREDEKEYLEKRDKAIKGQWVNKKRKQLMKDLTITYLLKTYLI